MSSLKDRLKSDLTAAMKARDELVTATLRMALAAVGVEEVSGKAARALTDDDVLVVLKRESKKRHEAAVAFEAGGRAESAARERAEGQILEAYLPKQLGDEELAEVVRSVLGQAGLAGPSAMGPAMKAVNAQLAGRADGGRVAAEVRRQLG